MPNRMMRCLALQVLGSWYAKNMFIETFIEALRTIIAQWFKSLLEMQIRLVTCSTHVEGLSMARILNCLYDLRDFVSSLANLDVIICMAFSGIFLYSIMLFLILEYTVIIYGLSYKRLVISMFWCLLHSCIGGYLGKLGG